MKVIILLSFCLIVTFANELCYECSQVNRDILAGQDDLMGHFSYTYDGEFVISAFADEEWMFKTIHLYIGTDTPNTTRAGNPIPGHFPYVYENINTQTFKESYDIDIPCGSTVNIAFHAEAIEMDESGNPIDAQTAWAFGNHTYSGSRWGWYSSYYTCCNTVPCEPIQEGSIGDLVWWDDNRNQIIDEQETGISGVEVILRLCNASGDENYLTTTTDLNGNYLFTNLPAGCYEVLIPNWDGNQIIADGENFTVLTTLSSIIYVNLQENENYYDADFGFDTNECPCESSDPCVISSRCDAGTCYYDRIECNDGVLCTEDSCFNGSCLFTPNNMLCEDNIPCTLDECDINIGGCTHTTMDEFCDDSVSCTIDSCDPNEGCLHEASNSNCDDKIECTIDICDLRDDCLHYSNDLLCNDNNLCTIDNCSNENGCEYTLISCDDGISCTTDECDPIQGCIHTPNDSLCNDNHLECSYGYCDITEGCIFTSLECDDEISCTVDSCSSDQTCIHTPINSYCNDDISCTFDSCNPINGCEHTLNHHLCDDGISCTTDECDPIQGCIHTPNDSLCDDNLSCTLDECSIFSGCLYTPMDSLCNDNITCTNDICSTVIGCIYNQDDQLCDDNNECTMDVCNNEIGCENTFIQCNDYIDCTIDSCDTLKGCIYDTNNQLCNDNDICTIDICSSELGCTHNDISCDDEISCTIDSCDPINGCEHTPMNSYCNDYDDCTTDICSLTQGCLYTNTCTSPPPPPPPPSSECENLPFSDASLYNLFSLSSIYGCYSDVEGRIASNGPIDLTFYSIGLKNQINGLYSLVSSSSINFNTGSVWFGKISSPKNNFENVALMIHGNTLNANECCNDSNCNECSSSSSPIDFESTEIHLLNLSTYWRSLSQTNNVTINYSYQSLTLTCSDDDYFNHFTNIHLNGVTSFEIICSSAQTVLIDYTSDCNSFSNLGFSISGGISSNQIIHHFISSELTVSGVHLMGNVFAPWSDLFFPQGLITGQVIVGGYVGSNENLYELSNAYSDDCAQYSGGHAITLDSIGSLQFDNHPQSLFIQFNNNQSATITGRVSNFDLNVFFDIVFELSDFSSSAPVDSPKEELLASCYIENGGSIDTSSWNYYQSISGSLTAVDGSLYEGLVLSISRRGPSAQFGFGANGKNIDDGLSFWFNFNVVQQSIGNDFPVSSGFGDVNVNQNLISSSCPNGQINLAQFSGCVPLSSF